jgi:hypothetical protein
MNVWMLVILFNSTTDSKMAIYTTEQECRKVLPIVKEMNKDDTDISLIDCMKGRIVKEKK